jgi:hypothetical protein
MAEEKIKFKNVDLHEFIKGTLKKKKISRHDFSRSMGMSADRFRIMLDAERTDVAFMKRMSEYLDFNLFELYTEKNIAEENTVLKSKISALENELKLLQEKVKVLESENKIYRDTMAVLKNLKAI